MQAFDVGSVFEDMGGIALMGRVKALDGDYAAQADISAINLKIYDMADPGTPINGSTGTDLTVSSVIFNTLQTSDPRWTKDSTGYNFLYVTTAAQLPSGGKRYRFEFVFTPAAGASYAFPGVFEVSTLGLYRS